MAHNLRLISLLVLVLVACQGPTPQQAESTPLPSPGISVVQSEPTSRETGGEDNANSLLATIASDPVELPTYVQGTSGEELVLLQAETVYYDIEGISEEELRAQMDELGPVDSSGYKGDALAEWFISWKWPGYGTDDCDLSKAEVSYNVEVIFPRWIPPEDASNNLIIKWFNYTYKLAKHEQGHVDFVVDNYQIVKEAIQGATCETAEEEAQVAIETFRDFDLEYDRQTGHGATQGARFP